MEEAGRGLSALASSGGTRLELFIGKGGAGKTTTAAATAVGAVGAGEHVLVVSVDQSHSLLDVFGVTAERRSESAANIFEIAPGLDVLEMNSLAVLEVQYRGVASILRLAAQGHEHGEEFGVIDAEELTGFPGAQELLALNEVVELVESGAWDAVCVDFPATADSLRFLALPDLFCDYLERTWPQHDRMVAGTGTDPRTTIAVALIERVATRVVALRDLIFDSQRTSVTLVATADRVCVAETSRTLSATALLGLPVAKVVVNRVLPRLSSGPISMVGVHPAVFWFEKWRADQQAALNELSMSVAPTPLILIRHSADEPVGLVLLAVLAGDLTPDDCLPVSSRFRRVPDVALESGSGLDSVYTLRLRLPVVDTSTVQLGRVEDDLIVGADGVRRRVRLASVLRRCIVTGAELASGDLIVRFEPNPELWPT